jgi:uncharacterized protein YndB with AHSA1/START domain
LKRFLDPAITSRSWFTRGSGRLEVGKQVRWDWEMYGVGTTIDVKALEPDKRILIEWDGPEDPNLVVAFPNVGGNAPASAAVVALTRTLSAELAPYGVRVVCLMPNAMPETGTIRENFENSFLFSILSGDRLAWGMLRFRNCSRSSQLQCR